MAPERQSVARRMQIPQAAMSDARDSAEEILVRMFAETRGLGEEDFEKVLGEKNLVRVEDKNFRPCGLLNTHIFT